MIFGTYIIFGYALTLDQILKIGIAITIGLIPAAWQLSNKNG